MGLEYPSTPRRVPKVKTKYRRIVTPIPAPASLALLKRLHKYEPRSMSGQPTVFWDKAEGFLVRDRWGNQWIDWSSGVLVANAGHARPEIVRAVVRQAQGRMLHNYCFPSEGRASLTEMLVKLAPKPLAKCFLLTTGAETTENAIKLALTWGRKVGGREKNIIVSFHGAFHGRTMGAQLAGGIPALRDWIPIQPPNFVSVPFPGDWRTKDQSFAAFAHALTAKNIRPERVCGVISETYQGGTASFLPVEFAKALRAWCDRLPALLIFDEVQAGFGRTGKLFAFQHYGIVPDLVCLGKGITSSLPLSAVLGRADVLDLFEPGSMTSTHTGNPLCCAAALESLKLIVREKLPQRAAKLGARLFAGLERLAARHRARVGHLDGKGLVAALQIIDPRTKTPDGQAALDVVRGCVERGLLLFSPVGPGGGSVKLGPPLIIAEDALDEGLAVLGEACDEALG